MSIFGHTVHTSAGDTPYTRPKNRSSFLLSYSNLMGLGGEYSYLLKNQISLNLIAGVSLSPTILWAPPYAGNLFNLSAGIQYHYESWIYIMAGGYIGLFELHAKIAGLEELADIWVGAPVVAIGIRIPRIKFGFEFGSAMGLPGEIVRIKKKTLCHYAIHADRSESAWGYFFPYFRFILKW